MADAGKENSVYFGEERRRNAHSSRFHYTVMAEKTLFDVLREIWRFRYTMLGCALVAVLLAFVFISVSKPFFRARMIIAPANHINVAAHGGVVSSAVEGSIGNGRTAVAGQNIDAFTVFGAVYNGKRLASLLAQDNKLLEALGDDCLFVFSRCKANKDAQSLSEYLRKHVHIEPVSGTSSLRYLSYMHPDKKFAAELLKKVHGNADEMIRERVLEETNQRIEYLENALVKTNNPEHRRSLTDLLMEQERGKMALSIEQPYAATIIEPAYVSRRAYWPDPCIIYPVFILVGLFLGYIVAIQFVPKNRK